MNEPENKERPPQATPSTSGRRKPPPKPPGWNTEKAKALTAQGVNQRDIASALGVHVNTVHRYLQKIKPEIEHLQTFRNQTGDALALTFARCCSILDKLLSHYDDDDVLAVLTAAEKERLLGKVSIAAGITFDKLRLHEGKSTTNSSHRILLEQVHSELRLPPLSSGSVSGASET